MAWAGPLGGLLLTTVVHDWSTEGGTAAVEGDMCRQSADLEAEGPALVDDCGEGG